MTNEILENEVDAVAADLPHDEAYEDVQHEAHDDSHDDSHDDLHEDVAATTDTPNSVQDDVEDDALEQAQEYEQEPAQDQGDARSEAEALFADMDADISEELLSFDDKEDAHSDLDSVPVALSFELGKVSLPLAEVRTLGPGGVVLFSGGSPASIAIVSAGQTLGRGEIVEVEGRLGIRVTQWRTPC